MPKHTKREKHYKHNKTKKINQVSSKNLSVACRSSYTPFEANYSKILGKNNQGKKSSKKIIKVFLKSLSYQYNQSKVTPQNDFYTFVNYRWLQNLEPDSVILDKRQKYITQVDDFRIVQDRVYYQLYDIMSEYCSKNHNPLSKSLGNFYKAAMRLNPIHDSKKYIDDHIQFVDEMRKDEKNIWKLAGREFNINSPKQLGEIIFDELNLSVKGMKKSAGGARSTRESELEKLKDLHPIIAEILQYRELQKLLSTYIDTIPTLIGTDGRLHSQFSQTGSSTGRFSSNNPNLQNIPIKTERGKNIRNAFIAAPGYVLASFDYSQIELRVAALLSQDEYFITVFKEGKDIHTAVAMKVFGVSTDAVTPEMRRRAKVINFGILYGMGVTALRQNLGGERKDAQIFYDNYFAQFPTIAAYLESIKNFARTHGYTETLFGRKRYFPAIKSPLPFMKAMAERMATNAPIQGTATADIIKIGMKKAEDSLAQAGLLDDVHLVLQVHDELIYEIKVDAVDQAKKIIEDAMEHAVPLEFLKDRNPVPLKVSFGFGKNWGELK